MPAFRSRTTIGLPRGIRAFLNLEAGFARDAPPDKAQRVGQPRDRPTVKTSSTPASDTQTGTHGPREDTWDGWLDSLAEDRRKIVGNDQPEYVKAAIDGLREELRIARITRGSTEALQALAGKTELRIHLGCGPDIRPGWVNVDLALTRRIDPAAHPDATFVNHDLRQGLPLEEASCAFIYSSHFFEHLNHEEGRQLLVDCYRALRPGGTFRVALPDLKGLFEAYLRRDEEFLSLLSPLLDTDPWLASAVETGTKTLVDYVNYGVYQSGEHKYIYDQEKLDTVLRSVGYGSVTPSSYQEGTDPGSPVRRRYSLYAEAVK